MECNCNNNNSNGGVIPWVRGNRLPLIICVYENVVTQEQVGDSTLTVNEMTRVPYTIQDNDTVTVIMKSGFRQVAMPFTTDGNKVMVTDNGELPTGAYTVEVTIERGDGARGRWQETRQVRIYENTSDAQLGEMYSIDADLFFYAKGDTGTGIADITNNPDGTLTITMTDGTSYTTEALKGDKGDKGDTGERGVSIVSFDVTGQTDVSVIYTVTFSDDTTQDISVPKGPQGDTGLTGNGISSTALNSDYTLTIAYTDGTTYTTPSIRGAQGAQGVSVIGFTQTGETATNTMYNLVFSDGRTQSVAIPKGEKGAKGDTGNPGPQGAQGPKGDTVTATDYTLYNAQGGSSEGAMSQDATTKAISAQTGYYTCGTAEGTAEKVVTVESGNLYKRTLGGHFKVKMTNANTAASGVTLQVGSEIATTLWYNGAAASASNTWDAGEVLSVYYDGTYYQASNAQGGGGKGGKNIEGNYGYIVLNINIGDVVGSPVIQEGSSMIYAEIKVNEGDIIRITSKGGNAARAWGYIDDERHLLSVEPNNGAFYENAVFVIPSGVDKVILNADVSAATGYPDYSWYYAKAGSADALQVQYNSDEYVIAKSLIAHDERLTTLENTTLKEDEAFVIAKALAKLNEDIYGNEDDSSSAGVVSGTVSYNNSDMINVIASSYGAGSYALEGKNWVSKLSLFSDFNVINSSANGASNLTQLSSIRNGNGKYSKYALAVCNENEGSLSLNVRVRELDNLCKTLVGMGVIPIIGTQWNTDVELSNAYKEYADSHKWMFMDLRYYVRGISKSLGSSFDSGTHLATRNDAVMSDFYSKYTDMLQRPEKSLKVFKLRSSYSTNSLDELVFHTNDERAERFYELNITPNGLNDVTRVDTPIAGVSKTLEYSSLYTTGVTFNNAALISAVLPCTNQHLSSVALAANITGNVTVYVRNVLAQPYPSATTYVRFTVSDTTAPVAVANEVYSDGIRNYTVYTTRSGENGSYYTMYCTGTFNESDPQTGTLTRVGGTAITIPYIMRESVTYSASSVITEDNVGHWVEISKVNGVYDATSLIPMSVDYDKIHFLIVGTSFTLSSPSVLYKGKEGKVYTSDYNELEYNDDNANSELINESIFGAVGTQLTYWKDTNNNSVVTKGIYEGANYIPEGSSVVGLTSTDTMMQNISSSITSNAPLYLEIWCRYFPEVYSDGSGNQITLSSYDFATLNVQVGNITVKKRISTAWGKYRIELRNLSNYNSSLRKIKLYSQDSNEIQVCKVSLKYKH